MLLRSSELGKATTSKEERKKTKRLFNGCQHENTPVHRGAARLVHLRDDLADAHEISVDMRVQNGVGGFHCWKERQMVTEWGSDESIFIKLILAKN